MKPAATYLINPGGNGPRARPVLSLISAAMVIGALISGCGGSAPTSSANQPAPRADFGRQFVAFAVCMRSHGVPDYPDPQVSSSGSDGHVTLSPGRGDPNSPAFKSAGHACHNLLPNGGKPVSSAQEQAQDVTFADCMRSHGVPDFPDADRDGAFTLPPTVNQQAPQFEHALQACMSVQPSSLSIDQGRGGP